MLSFLLLPFFAINVNSIVYTMSTLAGNTTGGFTNGIGNMSTFNMPRDLVAAADGVLYVSDSGNRVIRAITLAGVVTTFAGNGSMLSIDGPLMNSSFISPSGMVFDSNGSLYVCEYGAHKIRKISNGVVSTFAGNGTAGSANGVGTLATFNGPRSIAIDSSGNFYVTEQNSHYIRKITPAGLVSTLAGNGTAGSANGVGTLATFNGPYGIVVDTSGNVYVSDYNSHLLRKISPNGTVVTFAGTGTSGNTNGSLSNPTGLTIDPANTIYFSEYTTNWVRQISPQGIISSFLGLGYAGSNNYPIMFFRPTSVTRAGSGRFYVCDYSNNLIRLATPDVWPASSTTSASASATASATASISSSDKEIKSVNSLGLLTLVMMLLF